MEKTMSELARNLSEGDLKVRKATSLAVLKTQVRERQEVQDGVVYTFDSSDELLDQLIAFIKAERSCCPFFKFELTIRDVKNPMMLRITGPDGVKEFIRDELDM